MYESFASATSKISSPFALTLNKRNHFNSAQTLSLLPGHLKLLQIMKLEREAKANSKNKQFSSLSAFLLLLFVSHWKEGRKLRLKHVSLHIRLLRSIFFQELKESRVNHLCNSKGYYMIFI